MAPSRLVRGAALGTAAGYATTTLTSGPVYAASNGGVHPFDAAGSRSDDVSWVVGTGWA
jgi:hypothetical protein